MVFCPKCGSKDVVDVFCEKCLREERPLVKGFKSLKLSLCTSCHAVKHKGHWRDYGQDLDAARDLIEDFVEESIIFNDWANVKAVSVELLGVGKTDSDNPLNDKSGLLQRLVARVVVVGNSSGRKKAKDYEEEYELPVEVQNTLCDRCKKKGTQFFTGTLQLRNVNDERIRFVEDFFENSRHHINKKKKVKNGVDFLITSNLETEKIGLELQKRFGGVVKASTKLFSRDKLRSKDIYRVNILVKLPDFQVGDVIENYNKNKKRDELLVVRELGKSIKFFDLTRGKYVTHEFKDLVHKPLKVWVSQVIKVHPEVEVIHPTTYQGTRVYNQEKDILKRGLSIGDEVEITIFNNKVYLV